MLRSSISHWLLAFFSFSPSVPPDSAEKCFLWSNDVIQSHKKTALEKRATTILHHTEVVHNNLISQHFNFHLHHPVAATVRNLSFKNKPKKMLYCVIKAVAQVLLKSCFFIMSFENAWYKKEWTGLMKKIKQALRKRREGLCQGALYTLEMAVHLRYQTVAESMGWPYLLGEAEMENWTAVSGSQGQPKAIHCSGAANSYSHAALV